MKKQFLFLAVLLIGCSSVSNKENSVLEKLYGNIKTIHEKSISAEYDSIWQITPTPLDSLSTSYQTKHYDENGVLSEIGYFIWDSSLISKAITELSDNGEMIGSKTLDKDGKVSDISRLLYASKDSILSKSFKPISRKLIQKGVTINENGLIKEQYSIPGKNGNFVKFKFKHDDYGRVIEETWFAKDRGYEFGSTNTYKYLEFDNTGNWTKRIKFSEEEPGECILTTRDIIYR